MSETTDESGADPIPPALSSTEDLDLLKVLSDLDALTALDDRQSRSISRFRTALTGLDRPFDRYVAQSHITASAIVLGPRGVLLHRHRLIGRWIQPGGHIERGEAPWQAAVRETLEETGVHSHHPNGMPKLVHFDVHKGPRCGDHFDLRYLLLGDDEDPSPLPEESQEVAWLEFEEALRLADEALSGALLAAQAWVGEHNGFTGFTEV